ncbi:hypothetical protein BD410DRAFT_836559 [Rickenella mellea]|uniref:BTB domain-containing protein n=1 Tax=Rickenella mellea TaxID=50990 RepID=A0A4Y7QIS0_9AGAM|nr:hypothetical protein BD410DRAFT_836559 [Rickenella mellea]
MSTPFNEGDLILRTADAVQYHVWSKILTVASPFFRDLFNLPQPKGPGGIPIVDVSEDSPVIVALLRIIYPMYSQPLTDIELIRNVLGAALKYDIGVAVRELCGLLATRHSSNGMDALRTYAISCRYKLAEEARIAAKASLQFPITETYAEELEHIPAGDYFRLLQYHHLAFSAIKGLVNGNLSEYPQILRSHKCNDCWTEFSKRAGAILREAPHCQEIYTIQFMDEMFKHSSYSARNNWGCSHGYVHDYWVDYIAYLKAEVNRRIDAVKILVRFE